MATRYIYVVDGDRAVRRGLHDLLGSDPEVLVDCFPDGRAFLKAAPGLEAGLVILDVRLHYLSGLDILRSIRSQDMPFAVVFLTRFGSVRTAVEAMQAGALDFIERPIDQEELVARIAEAWAKIDADRARKGCGTAARLSPDELAVLLCLARGLGERETARELGLSPHMVEVHRASLMGRLDARTLPEAIRAAEAAGLFPA